MKIRIDPTPIIDRSDIFYVEVTINRFYMEDNEIPNQELQTFGIPVQKSEIESYVHLLDKVRKDGTFPHRLEISTRFPQWAKDGHFFSDLKNYQIIYYDKNGFRHHCSIDR